jgi:hypothetical protein
MRNRAMVQVPPIMSGSAMARVSAAGGRAMAKVPAAVGSPAAVKVSRP